MDDNKFWIRFWLIICTSIVLVVASIIACQLISDQQMIDAGYILKQTPVHFRSDWVKP